jgi:hypothetical protein
MVCTIRAGEDGEVRIDDLYLNRQNPFFARSSSSVKIRTGGERGRPDQFGTEE